MRGVHTRRALATAALLALALGFTAGCTGDHHGSSGASAPAATSPAPSDDPSGLAEMRKKVDAAESAAAAADKDTAQDADH